MFTTCDRTFGMALVFQCFPILGFCRFYEYGRISHRVTVSNGFSLEKLLEINTATVIIFCSSACHNSFINLPVLLYLAEVWCAVIQGA